MKYILPILLPNAAFAVNLSLGTLYISNTTYLDDRDDGQPGYGTINNPYDASDADKLTALWSSVGSRVVFKAGTYFVKESLSCSGKTIRGEGTNSTLIQWTNVSEGFGGRAASPSSTAWRYARKAGSGIVIAPG